jgi:carboxypeptidase D
MFGRSITAVLAIALLVNGSEARQSAQSHEAKIDTSNYRFLTNKTKCMLYFIYSFNLD